MEHGKGVTSSSHHPNTQKRKPSSHRFPTLEPFNFWLAARGSRPCLVFTLLTQTWRLPTTLHICTSQAGIWGPPFCGSTYPSMFISQCGRTSIKLNTQRKSTHATLLTTFTHVTPSNWLPHPHSSLCLLKSLSLLQGPLQVIYNVSWNVCPFITLCLH